MTSWERQSDGGHSDPKTAIMFGSDITSFTEILPSTMR
jgi:hypothetical protein